MFVGAPFDGQEGSQLGTVSVYKEVSDNSWELFNKITSTDGEDRDRFGVSLDIDDMSTFVVGANVSILFGSFSHNQLILTPLLHTCLILVCISKQERWCRRCIFIRNVR